jgi:mono/diheme cytochrome c family protein
MRLAHGYLTTLAISATFCVTTARVAHAQQHRATSGQKSTLAGVYSAEQASRGEDLYAGMCKSCHTTASHTGVAFQKSWDGRALADLFSYISTKMPKNEPGSLAPEEYVDLLAYLLKLNQMPVGTAELPPDTTMLGAIRIQTRAAPSHPDKR